MSLKEEDVKKILACGAHIGTTGVDFQMEQYVYKQRPDGVYLCLSQRLDRFCTGWVLGIMPPN